MPTCTTLVVQMLGSGIKTRWDGRLKNRREGEIKACIIIPGIKCILKKLPGLEHSLVVECLHSIHKVLNGIPSLGPKSI